MGTEFPPVGAGSIRTSTPTASSAGASIAANEEDALDAFDFDGKGGEAVKAPPRASAAANQFNLGKLKGNEVWNGEHTAHFERGDVVSDMNGALKAVRIFPNLSGPQPKVEWENTPMGKRPAVDFDIPGNVAQQAQDQNLGPFRGTSYHGGKGFWNFTGGELPG